MARDFDGTNDRITLTSQSQADADFTTALWVYADAAAGGERLWVLSDGTRSFRFQIVAGPLLRAVLHLGTQVNTDSGGGGSLSTGVWTHWAFRFRTSDNQKDIFKDGTSVGSNTTSPGTTAVSSSTLAIGADDTGGNPFNGRIADARWWDAFLSGDEISMAMRGFVVRPDALKVWWPLFGVQSPEPDWSGNGRHGTVTEAVRIDHPPGISAIPFWTDKRFLFVPAVAAAKHRRTLLGVGA